MYSSEHPKTTVEEWRRRIGFGSEENGPDDVVGGFRGTG